ncbi:MAG TPA: long-chain fatty acid--CoA ligase [Pseudonocardia sp.]|nr:long-chain fatty acid--CoA ligase [Pseudonocardia sp.]
MRDVVADDDRVSAEVLAERADMDAVVGGHTVCSTFRATVRRQPEDVALRVRAGDGWTEITWAEYADRALRIGAALRAMGVQPGDRIAMLLRNRPEFHYVDTGAMLARAVPVSIYNSSPPGQVRHFVRHSRARVVFCDDDTVAANLNAVMATERSELPDLLHVEVLPRESGRSALADLLRTAPLDLDEATDAVEPSDIANVIYTSGTTGAPKGVMLSHRNVTFAVESFARAMNLDLRGLDAISYLPMAHIAERVCTHWLHVRYGTRVTTCDDITQIGRYMVEVRPGWWFSAPRMWEKLHAAVESRLAADPALAREFHAAQELGGAHFALANEGEPVPEDLRKRWARARADVISPVLAELGLDRVRISITGSAPMPRHVFDFFTRCGLPLSDCYGQSESTGFVAWDPRHVVPGTSGRRFPGTELRIAEDGEILSRGPTVFAGYLDAPDLTAQVVDERGWLHTGDLGRLDDGGNLHIVGRKKEMIVPTSGHNVSPVAIEAALKESPLIAQACVVGDGRPHIAALLVLDVEGLGARAASAPDVLAEIEAHVALANERFPRPERVRSYRILDHEWLPDTDVMTPTAKLKRHGIHTRYAEEIDHLYASAAGGT